MKNLIILILLILLIGVGLGKISPTQIKEIGNSIVNNAKNIISENKDVLGSSTLYGTNTFSGINIENPKKIIENIENKTINETEKNVTDGYSRESPTINESSNKNAKTVLDKYGFQGISELVKNPEDEKMLKQQLVIAILQEYHIKGYKNLSSNQKAYQEYQKGLSEINSYK